MEENEEIQEQVEKSEGEFVKQQDLADKRIDHMITMQDQLRNHICLLESINQLLEQKAKNASGDDKIRIAKSISYNYDRLIKLYEVYQTYEQSIQRYHIHLTDTINKKYQININKIKNRGVKTSLDFFRSMHEMISGKNVEEIQEFAKIEDEEYEL